MNRQHQEKAGKLIAELWAIHGDVTVMRGTELENPSSITSVLEVQALEKANMAIQEAIDALKEARA